MGIGGSDGAYYEDDFDRLTGNDGNKPDEGSKGSRAPSDVSITFRGTPNPSGDAASGSKRTPLDPNTPGVVNPDLNPNLDTKDWNERVPDTLPAPQDISGKAVPIAYDTKLSPEQESIYQQRYGQDADRDYDMRGYYQANPDVQPNQEGQHYPDTYKKPNHPTFSDESIYHGQNGEQGGHWGVENGQDTFTPGSTNLKNWGRAGLQDYFNRVEPNVKLNLPPNIEDRRQESPAKAGLHFIGESLTPGAAEDLIRNPAGQSMIPNSPLGEELGMKDLPEPGQSWVDRLSMVNALKGMAHGPNTDEDINLLKGFYNTVKQAFKLPGEVFAGKVDPMSQQGIERSADLAGLMVGGPAPVAAKMADGTLGSFAGVRSLAGRTDDFATSANVRRHFAERMEQDGAHPDEIWNKTGWMRGTEGKWKYEIDDSKAKFDNQWPSKALDRQAEEKAAQVSHGDPLEDELSGIFKQTPFDPNAGTARVKLSEVWDHPELYKAYPELKNIDVIYDPTEKGGYYNPYENNITLGPGYTDEGVIAHEVQHAIQEKEGFARGGAPGDPGKHYQLKLQQAYDDFMTEAKRRLPEIDKKFAKGLLSLSNEDMDFIHQYSQVQRKFPEYMTAAKKQAYENYMRLAGEVEARNSASRGLLTQQERRAIPPSATIEPEYLNRQATFTGKGKWATPYGYKNEQLKDVPER